MTKVSNNGNDNNLYEENQDRDTYDIEICDHYKKSFLTNAEKKSCPNGWFALNDLQQNESVLGRYRQPQFNSNTFRVGVKLITPMDHWTDSVECEWWLSESYHPPMKSITIDM